MLTEKNKNTKSDKKLYICEECFGAKDIFNGEDYVKCNTCFGNGKTTKLENYKFLSKVANQD